MVPLIDQIRDVPETAVRLYLGAKAARDNGSYVIELDGRTVRVAPEVYTAAAGVCRALQVRPRTVEYASDILELRHAAEDFFLQDLFGGGKPSVLFVPAGLTASGYYRAMIPADLMAEGGRVLAQFTHRIDIAKALRYDVLWVQLLTDPMLLDIARAARSAGLRIVYDIDDRLDAIPAGNQAATVYGTPAKQQEIKDMIGLADVVTVSTAPLAAHITHNYKVGGSVVVLPNMLTANVMPRRHTPDPAITRIIWAGSPTHQRDLAVVAPAICATLLRHAGKVRFTCFGERVPEPLAAAYPYIDLKQPVDFEEYHDALAGLAGDFAIAPLEDNPFNESKSAIKALEYAAAGYPMLLSPVGEYPAVVAAGLPAELVHGTGWETALEAMVAVGRARREAVGQACIKWVCAQRCMARVKAAPWADVVCSLVPAKVAQCS